MPEVEEALSVRKQGEQFAGALIYSFLAEQCKEDAGKDAAVMDEATWKRTREQDDGAIKP